MDEKVQIPLLPELRREDANRDGLSHFGGGRTMSRYIDADALTWLVEEYKLAISPITEEQERDNRLPMQMLTEFENMIAEQPTVDAVPVVHGEWVEKWRFKPNGNPYHKVGDMECSVCHSDMLGRYYSRYCPHCGAKMEGERR